MIKVVPVVLIMLLGACTTVDPYTGDQQTSNATKGAGVGAVAGAVVGAMAADNRKKGALTGAVAGAAAGGGIGYYMDQQEAALRSKLQSTGVRVQREGDAIRLVMPGDITFDVGSYAIKPDFFSVLNGVAQVLGEYERTAVRISGHTDSTGSLAFNQTLSEQRANSVSSYLREQNIQPGRLRTSGYGPNQPIAGNDTAEGRQRNRRVEIQLIPLQ